MTKSIRTHLFVNLIFSLIFVTFTSIAINLAVVHKKFTEAMDLKLFNQFAAVRTVNKNESIEQMQKYIVDVESLKQQLSSLTKNIAKSKNVIPTDYQLQIWNDQTHTLILHSTITPNLEFFKYPTGFNNFSIGKKKGRVFVYHDKELHLTYALSLTYEIVDIFEDDLVLTTIIALLLAAPFVGLFIWLIVSRGLASITQVTNEVKRRLPHNLTPVNIKEIPKEIQPLAIELNNLFTKLQEAFIREKRFASDAAHELKTPLAALKIQAQVALNTDDTDELRSSLINVVKGVDRSTHIVNQLLTLSRALPEASTKKELVSLNKEATTIITDVIYFAKQKNIELELIAPDAAQFVEGNPITIGVLIRNLVDNAIRYTPRGGLVQIVIESNDKNVKLKVIDNGRGISEDMREKVFDRFFRVLGTEEAGCGLGLSIVKQIAHHHNADIKLVTPPSGEGLEIDVTFIKPNPKSSPQLFTKSVDNSVKNF